MLSKASRRFAIFTGIILLSLAFLSAALLTHPAAAPPDTDGDGLPDAWEQQIVDADDADALRTVGDVRPDDDFDADGRSNFEEYALLFDPASAEETDRRQLALVGDAGVRARAVTMRLRADNPQITYLLHSRVDPQQDDWTGTALRFADGRWSYAHASLAIASQTEESPGIWSVSVAVSTGAPERSFRLSAPAAADGMDYLRTPDSRFDSLAGYDFEPHYVYVDDYEGGVLRMHYIDEGPIGAPAIIMVHGNPTWIYQFRQVIPQLNAAGYRTIAIDLIGMGRSDKPTDPGDYTYDRHVGWVKQCFAHLDDTLGLGKVTFFGHDYGTPIGIRLMAEHYPNRFDAFIDANASLPDGSYISPVHLNWRQFVRDNPDVPVGHVIDGNVQRNLTAGEIAAYYAPWPDTNYKEAIRTFPEMVPESPNEPEAVANLAAWAFMENFQRPFMTIFGRADSRLFNARMSFVNRVPGAYGQPHPQLNVTHYAPEDKPDDVAGEVLRFLADVYDTVPFSQRVRADFKTGFDGFVDGGADCLHDAGLEAVQLRNNNGAASATWPAAAMDLSKQEVLKVAFRYLAANLVAGDEFVVELWDGSSWVGILTLVYDDDFQNDVKDYGFVRVTRNDVAFAADAQIRVRCNAAGTGNRVNLLDLAVETKPARTGTLSLDNEFEWDGVTRTFNYYEPENLNDPHALVFVLHGGGVNADLALTTLNTVEWLDIADRHGVLIIAPDGRPGVQGLPQSLTWNDGRADNNTVSTADDVGFVNALLAWAEANYPDLDTERVYAVGASNGGMMAWRLGQELSHRIAAVGMNVAFKPAIDEAPDPTYPISVIMFAGDADPQMPWGGGYVGGRTAAGSVLSAFQTRDYLIALNNCNPTPAETTSYPDSNPNDGPSTVQSKLYTGGDDNTAVKFYRIFNGGHIQPSIDYAINPDPVLIGNENRDISGVQHTWDFFAGKTLGIVNYPPEAVDDTASTDEDSSVTVDVLANDSDVENDSLTLAGVTAPANGDVSITPDDRITYTPDADYHGPDSFSYTVSDGRGGSDSATVSVTVNPVNDPPVAVAETFDSPTIAGATVTLTGSNSTDPDSGPQPLSYSWDYVSGPVAQPGPALTDLGNWIEAAFVPTADGVYTFELTVDDGDAADSDEVQIIVGDVLIVDLPASATEGDGTVSGTIRTSRVLAAGESITVTISSDDESEVEVQSPVTITAGTDSQSFEIYVKNDAEDDDGQTATIRASAADWVDGQASMTVDDDEEPAIEIAGDADFGSVALGSSADRTFTIRNSGTAALTISGVSFSGANAGEFSVDSPPASTVPAGGQTSCTVAFTPAASGPAEATMQVACNDPDSVASSKLLAGSGSSGGGDDDDGGLIYGGGSSGGGCRMSTDSPAGRLGFYLPLLAALLATWAFVGTD